MATLAGFSSCSLWCPSPRISIAPSPSPPLHTRLRVSCCASPKSSITSTKAKTLSQILDSGVIACLRANNAELAMEAASTAIRGGISVLEIVRSTPGVFQVLCQLVQDHPTVAFGVGTVLSAEDVRNAKRAGAKFLMSPIMVKIFYAYDAGAKVVKVYPVSALGGVQYISAIKKPFPNIPMVASQGITIGLIGDYIACGAASVVLSDAIFDKEAMRQKNFDAIYQLACLAVLRGKEALDRKRQMTPLLADSFRGVNPS
ncbi:putative KHG/KDPG aldolase isoform X3 [Tripterygium wilfordii]|uniref:putative KHG/KDPG aldolase isoform X3 n=1 Tax=Tripterygium wilfordii TaxID=458696 RepID=UPI0018F85486|nr:putative KHG/KDPG aldolase isoform X3 [Tripterygium wilfordii]